MRIDYFELVQDAAASPTGQARAIPGATFTNGALASQAASRLPSVSLQPRALVLDEWTLETHTFVTMSVTLHGGRLPPLPAGRLHPHQVQIVENEVRQDRVTTFLVLRDRWSKPTSIYSEGPSYEKCLQAIQFRLDHDPYDPPPHPGHWREGEAEPPDMSRTHWTQPDGSMWMGEAGYLPPEVTSVAPAASPAPDPLKPDIEAPPRAAAPVRPAPPPSTLASKPSVADLVEHAERAGIQAIPCNACQTVCIYGGNMELREYHVKDVSRDDYETGCTHTRDRCLELVQAKLAPAPRS